MTVVRIVPAGDSAILLELEERIDERVNARVIGIAESLQRQAIAGVRDIVPTYRSVAVYFDPLRTDQQVLVESLEGEAARQDDVTLGSAVVHRVPVCYGGEFGPDLAAVADFAGIAEADAVAIHSGATYRVFMLGFMPGFAYMGVLDPRIAAPRRLTPRARVAAGSVGIAGPQTGIYPMDAPGGWQLIGRTPLRPFDPARANPFLVKAGDSVEFYPITRGEFDGWPSA